MNECVIMSIYSGAEGYCSKTYFTFYVIRNRNFSSCVSIKHSLESRIYNNVGNDGIVKVNGDADNLHFFFFSLS